MVNVKLCSMVPENTPDINILLFNTLYFELKYKYVYRSDKSDVVPCRIARRFLLQNTLHTGRSFCGAEKDENRV